MAKTPHGKKDNNNKNVNKSAKSSSSLSCGKIFLLVSAVFAVLVSYGVYIALFAPASLPELDLDQWWGPLPRNPKQDVSIRPYKVEFSDVVVNDLKERLLHRRPFTPPLEDIGFEYGFNTHFLTRVLDYWQNNYDFKERERFLNRYDHFVTNVQGLDIHYIHVKPEKSSDVEVLPILLLHGWPGSVREFYEMIPLLTQKRAGYKFVFEIIAPSLPGYGFSQAAVRPGLGSAEVAVVMRNLMHRIGHKRFYVHGGDWGGLIGSNMGTFFPDEVIGFHTNAALTMHPLATVITLLGSLWPSMIVEPELQSRMYPYSDFMAFIAEETGYLHIQATKPDTVGVALTDSPAGLAAYILEKFSTWTNRNFKRAADGDLLKKFTLTQLLDNVMIYWSTNTITSSMRLYSESFNKRSFALNLDRIPITVPTWGIQFKYEIAYQPISILKLKFKNYLQSTVVEDGGHFAAFELPTIMADDIFKAVEAFKEFHKRKEIPQESPKTIYDFTVKDISGKEVKLEKYKGHVLIIVNVASQCGLTDTNYKQLNELYDKYSETKGLRILAFPCNQFNGQEPGSPKDILAFAKERRVKFDLFEKIDVNGDNTHPLWKFLKTSQGGTIVDAIKWNFSKFIVDKNGVPVERFGPNVNPIDLVPSLSKYW